MGKHNRHSDDDDDMFECAYCGKTHSDDSVAENAVATLNEEQEEKECTMDDATSADGKDVRYTHMITLCCLLTNECRCMFQCRNGWTVAYGTKVVAVTNAVRSDIPWGEDVVVLDKVRQLQLVIMMQVANIVAEHRVVQDRPARRKPVYDVGCNKDGVVRPTHGASCALHMGWVQQALPLVQDAWPRNSCTVDEIRGSNWRRAAYYRHRDAVV